MSLASLELDSEALALLPTTTRRELERERAQYSATVQLQENFGSALIIEFHLPLLGNGTAPQLSSNMEWLCVYPKPASCEVPNDLYLEACSRQATTMAKGELTVGPGITFPARTLHTYIAQVWCLAGTVCMRMNRV